MDKFKAFAMKSGMSDKTLIDLIVNKFLADIANLVTFSTISISTNWKEWAQALEQVTVHRQHTYQ